MKKIITTSAFFFLSIITSLSFGEGWGEDGELSAQNISINGTGAIADPSAILDVSSPTLGLLVPRVALTAINVATPITSPTLSLLVFNTATASTGTNAVSAGYYYWDGTKWVRFAYNQSGNTANDWSITGNAGTVAGTNFIGTTDDVDLVFKRNGVQAGLINSSSGNTSFGANALSATSTGSFNTAVGESAGSANTTGSYNSFYGQHAGFANTTGQSNVFVGGYSGNSNILGSANTFVGYYSGLLNTGDYNTFLGERTGRTNTTGSCNTFLGERAGFTNASGSFNTSLGYLSLLSNTTGTNNVAIGASAGYSNTIGYNNIFIGTNSDATAGTFTNATAIGYNAKVGQSNALILGGTGADAVNVGIGTTTPAYKLDIFEGLGGANTVAARFETSTTSSGIAFKNTGTTSQSAIFSKANDLSLWTSGNSRLWVTSAGNVGIGTGFSTPTEKLEVQGSVKIVDGTQGIGKVLMSDATGKGSWQSQIGSWYAHLDGGASANVVGGSPTINFTSAVTIGVGGSANFTTDQIIVPSTGLYRVIVSGFASGLTSPYVVYWNVLVNGGFVWGPHNAYPALSYGSNASAIKVLTLNAGDVLTLQRNNTNSAYEGPTAQVLYSVELIQ